MPVKDWVPPAAQAAASERRLRAGEHLFRLGSRTLGLFEVVAGQVRLARVDRSGHEVVLQVAGPGETLAEASLFAPLYQCDAIASTDASVRLYPKGQLLTSLERDPKAAKAFSSMLAQLVMSLRARLEQRNIRSARERIRHFLALNVATDGRTVELRGTLKDLAAELGLTHEALYRAVAALEHSGEVKRRGRSITLSKRV